MKKVSRIIAACLLAGMVVFVCFALNHPEFSFPWGNKVTYPLYAAYAAVMVLLFVAPWK